jgi:hypothetical protein
MIIVFQNFVNKKSPKSDAINKVMKKLILRGFENVHPGP